MTFTMDMRTRVEKFIEDLDDVFRKHKFTIDCHAEFVSVLKDTTNCKDEFVCCLYGDCEPDYDEIAED